MIGIRATIGLAIVPGMLAAASITIAARQARRTLATPTARTTLSLNLREMRQAGIVRALAPAAAFELGNLAATLLILRATDLLQTGEGTVTTATRIAILRYAGHNAVAALTAVAAGTLTDRIGSRRVFAVGPHPWPWLLAGFALAGLGIGLAETAQSATVALLLPDRLRGTGFGALGLVQAFGDLGTSVVAGLLWAAVSPTLAFGYAAAWMTLSLLASLLVPRTIPAPEAAPAGARPGQVRTKVPDHEQQPRASIEP